MNKYVKRGIALVGVMSTLTLAYAAQYPTNYLFDPDTSYDQDLLLGQLDDVGPVFDDEDNYFNLGMAGQPESTIYSMNDDATKVAASSTENDEISALLNEDDEDITMQEEKRTKQKVKKEKTKKDKRAKRQKKYRKIEKSDKYKVTKAEKKRIKAREKAERRRQRKAKDEKRQRSKQHKRNKKAAASAKHKAEREEKRQAKERKKTAEMRQRKTEREERQELEKEKRQQRRLHKKAREERIAQNTEDRRQRRAEHRAMKKEEAQEKRDERRAARIKREEDASLRQEKRLERVAKDHADGKYAFLYKVPAWPRYCLPYEKKDLMNGSVTYKTASSMFDSSGRKRDVSAIAFGENCILFKNFVLSSRLLDLNKVNSVIDLQPTVSKEDNPLFYLRNTEFMFDGSIDEVRADFDYARRFCNDDVSLGIEVPVVYRKHRLRYCVNHEAGVATKLNDPTNIINTYYGGFDCFFRSILAEKGINFTGKDTKTGLGDVSLFLNYQIHSRNAERILVGGRATFPAAQNRDTTRLWAPELGNGGFPVFSAFGSVLFARGRYCNPHLFGQVSYFVPAGLVRRVPRKVTLPANPAGAAPQVDQHIAEKQLLKSELITFKGGPNTPEPGFNEFDGNVRGLADTTRRVKLSHGPEVDIRIGNTFERVILRRLFMDLLYNLHVRGSDTIHSGVELDHWNVKPLTENTYQVVHTLATQLQYQFDEYFRLKFDLNYVFAGRNTPHEFSVGGTLSAEF